MDPAWLVENTPPPTVARNDSTYDPIVSFQKFYQELKIDRLSKMDGPQRIYSSLK